MAAQIASALPSISLVTANYNLRDYVGATLRSVLNQNYPGLEYIVIDGASTDGSQKVIEEFAPALAHYRSEPDRGSYDAINKGFAVSTGEVMGWLNSDDLHLPQTLQIVGEVFSAFPSVEWITTQRLVAWDAKGRLAFTVEAPGYSRESFLDGRHLPGGQFVGSERFPRRRLVIQQESTFWRRSLWNRAGSRVPTEFGSAGDFALWCKFAEHADITMVSYPLAGFRHRAGQQSGAMDTYGGLAVQALDATRKRQSHRMTFGRRVSHGLRLWAWPKISGWARRRFGYRGQRIVAENLNLPTCSWRLENYEFL